MSLKRCEVCVEPTRLSCWSCGKALCEECAPVCLADEDNQTAVRCARCSGLDPDAEGPKDDIGTAR